MAVTKYLFNITPNITHIQVFISIKYMAIFWLKSAILFPGLRTSERKSVRGSLLYIPRNQNPQVRGNWWVSGKCNIILKRFVTDCLLKYVKSLKIIEGKAKLSKDFNNMTYFRTQSIASLISLLFLSKTKKVLFVNKCNKKDDKSAMLPSIICY